eukprot:TRINITY_DN291_c1_g1_i2.p1 TRINITY_DN291_c1_g1~~TRINITY_DN291_c1_g1_i2.p1  ORF type:complete len:736 (+),score=138.09 TRINITY_DN291_c1_g1_i2:186-2393(+)
MTDVHRSKLSNQDSVFKDKEDPICSIPLTPNEDEVDMYALYAEIDKIRNEFQENFTTKHPWYPILEELVRTEEQYFNDIDSIVENYIPDFESMQSKFPDVISPETPNIIFINLQAIRDFHKRFYRSLKPILSQESLIRVGKLFQDEADNFKIYSEYCSNHSNSVELLVKLTKNGEVNASLRLVQNKLKHPLNLSTYLLKPVQRVLKYKLLLESMIKHAKQDSDEKALLQSAAERMDSITKEINELKAMSENKQMLEEVHVGLDLTPYKGLLTDYGQILLQSTMLDLKAAKSRQERLVLLLEDALLICKVRDKQTRNAKTIGRTRGKRNAPYKFKDFILLKELTFTQDDHRGDDLAFLVHKQNGRNMTTYCLRAKSIVNKNHWVSTLQEQIVASYGFDQDLLRQIMGTLKSSTSSLNTDSASNSPAPQIRSLAKMRLLPISPSVDILEQERDSSDEERRPHTMYDYIDSTQSVPIYTKQSSDIVCEKVHSEFPDRTVMSKARTYSKTIDTRPRLPTPKPKLPPDVTRERDSGISESQEYSNAQVKQQMREVLCTMQQDYATFTGSTRERDSGVEEGDTSSQLDFLSLKRKHEGLVQSLVKSYMSTVTQQNTFPPKQTAKPSTTSTDNNLNLEKLSTTQVQLSPPKLLKPPLSPKPSALKKKFSNDNRSRTLPRVINPSFQPDSPTQRDSSPDSGNSFPLVLASPTRRTSAAGTTRVLGMKDHWEKTIVAHREECNK